MMKSVNTLNRTFEKTDRWLAELCQISSQSNKELAYSILRAVLHAIRDRLTIEQTIHFASELPLLIQGIYYENWTPAGAPRKDDINNLKT
ncbi:MAG TPA: DUF2267 domain-containing protein [Coxiellaceae bacterium]|nr:DUF2267 domain-containing protein [Coxiellaceae bacterium]